MYQQVPRRRHVTQHHGSTVKIETLRYRHPGIGWNSDALGKTARPMNAHHSGRADVAVTVLGAELERHDACRGDVVADFPAGDLRPDGVDDAGAIDTRNERQRRAACRFLAGAQANVEHAINGRGMHLDADLARARHRIGPILIAQHVGRAVFVDNDCFHSRFCRADFSAHTYTFDLAVFYLAQLYSAQFHLA